MSSIIAGRFDTFPAAEAAATALFAQGFAEADVTMFYVNPPGQHSRYPIGGDRDVDPGARKAGKGAGGGVVLGAVAGAVIGTAVLAFWQTSLLVMVLAAGIGAYLGSLVGALALTRDPARERQHAAPGAPKTVRDAGVLLAVHVSGENRDTAIRVLRSAGAHDTERASGKWQDGKWVDFDPLRPPMPAEQG